MISTVTVPITDIGLNDRGVAYIRGTRIKVRFIAQESNAGNSVDGIQEAYPHLHKAQIYAALAYYHAHKAEIDHEIEDELRFIDEMQRQNPNPLTRADFLARLGKDE